MEVRCVYDKLVPIADLKAHPKNPNKHSDDQIARLAQILDYQGFRSPVVVSNLSGFIVAGHGRLAAAQKLGATEVPVNFQEFKSEEQEYAHIVADNAIAEWAELDLSTINTEVGELGPDFDIDLLGLKDFEIEVTDKLEPGADEDDVPEEQADPGTVVGDIWKLGRHRLMCGDATNVQHVDALLDGNKVDMVYTDPPYGMRLDTDYSKMPRGEKKYSAVIGDDKDFDPNCLFAVEADRYCVWGADWFYSRMPEGFSPIVWDKQPHHTVAGPQNHFELCWVQPAEKRRTIRRLWTGFTAKEKGENRVHPTQKPVEVVIDTMERGGNSVLDLFGGSGSTLIACEKTNRTCYMMELEPKYVRVIIDRWEKCTGQKAELING